MNVLQETYFFIYAFYVFSVFSIVLSKESPLWTWDCVDDKCLPFKAVESEKLQSLESCNMLCSTIQLWPQPTGSVSLATTAVPIRADFIKLDKIFAPSNVVRQHLRDAFQLFHEDISNIELSARGNEWYNVSVTISVEQDEDPRMRIDTDESYKLSLQPSQSSSTTLKADIKAVSFCGARHGLETLSQLIWMDPYADSMFILQAASVLDEPKFRYRGLLLDTARSYFPLCDLLRTIDAMAACKLNTFHWHITDSQAFSLYLDSVPLLAQYGAYSVHDVYSSEQVKELVRRARLRGIRILIEVDVPAHVGRAWAWGPTTGHGDLAFCYDEEPWTMYCTEPPCGQLNPRNPHVFEVLQNIYAEIFHLTEVDDIFHLGGDDVSELCWSKYFNDTEPINLWINFTKSALQCLENVNGNLPNLTLLWFSRLSKIVKVELREYSDFLGLHIRNVEWTKRHVSGLRAVLSHEDAWDLNSGLGYWYESSGGASYNSWERMYEHRPWARGVGVVEGGEVTAWSWSLNSDNMDARIWPRAAAFAERLWSDRPEGATRPVHARLDVHRTRLTAKGVKPAPIWSFWCTQNTYSCS